MRILYVTTVSITMGFFFEHFKMLQDEGHTIELACNCDSMPIPQKILDMNLKTYNMPFSRFPFSKSNIKAAKELKKLVQEGNYDIVHTHTPNASAVVRLVCRKFRKKGLKVFYTAHGFHFYKGAPIKAWLIYYLVEKLCSRWTDTLITINQEDFEIAQKKLKAKKTVYVPGVGIDLSRFGQVKIDKSNKRKELGIPEDAVLLLSVGELNDNKNHEAVIKAINGMNVYYIIAGRGDKQNYLQNLIDSQGMTDKIKLLGYRTDVSELYSVADIFVFPSFREGLSVSLMEAMASGLPCTVSRIRGNTDLIDENGGSLFEPNSESEIKVAICGLIKTDTRKIGEYNMKKVQKFSNEAVLSSIQYVYNDFK